MQIDERLLLEDEPDSTPEEEGKYATFQQRFGGLMIDVGVLTALAILMAMVTKDLPEELGYIRLVSFLCILFTYEPLLSISGGTLGHRAMKIRIRKRKDEMANINLVQAYIRLIVKITCGPFLGFKWMNRKMNLAIHDIASGSVALNVGN